MNAIVEYAISPGKESQISLGGPRIEEQYQESYEKNQQAQYPNNQRNVLSIKMKDHTSPISKNNYEE